MPQTQDQVKTQETARRIIRIFADDPGLLLGAISPVASDRREADEELVPKIAAILDETREAGPDLLDKATEPCRVPDTDKIPPDTEVAVSKLDNATDREAWLQGYWAHAFGLDLDRNPYEEHRVWKAWFEGWQWADAEDEG